MGAAFAVAGGCCWLAVQQGTHQVWPVVGLATTTACAARGEPHEARVPG